MSRKISKHDKSVIRRAAALESYGWRVHADVSGFDKPRTLRVHSHSVRPDIIAKKGKKTRIVEVETPTSFRRDINQRRLLRKYAKNRPNTEVRVRRMR